MQPPTDRAALVEARLPRGQRNLHEWIRARREDQKIPWDRVTDLLKQQTGMYVTRQTLQAWWDRMESERQQAAAEDPQ